MTASTKVIGIDGRKTATLSAETLRASARAAAEQGVPHDEANHFERGSQLWVVFHEAYHGVVEVA